MVKNLKKNKTPILLFLITFVIYFLSKEKTFTPWNHYVRLADSFLHGQLHLLDYQPFLEAAHFQSKYFPVSPPIPAILLMPLVALFGKNFPQPIVSFFFGALNPVLLYLLLTKIKVKHSFALISSLLLAFGTNHWYLASVGSYWYLAHIISVAFILIALLEAFGQKRPLLIGLLLGAAFLSRLPTILAFPFFAFLIGNQKSKSFKKVLYLALGISFSIIFALIYNYLRFGSFFEFGYDLIPNLLKEPWYQKGFLSLSYLPKNLKKFLWTFPTLTKEFPFLLPSRFGMAIWINTPAFLSLPRAIFIKEKIIFLSFLTIIFLALPSLIHGEAGGYQFGYRYSLDYFPFLLILIAKSFEKLPKPLIISLVLLSLLINFWGVLLFNKLGFGA